MSYSNTGYSGNMSMFIPGYGAGMYSYNQGATNIYKSNISGSYLCNTVNVIDMSGMIRKRLDCTPISNTGMLRLSNTIY